MTRPATGRRAAIIEAALQAFVSTGYEQASLEDIRKRSGASIGSIYHHFHSKEQLAAAVFLEGIVRWQEGFTDALTSKKGAKAGIRAVIQFHLIWVRDHPDWARFLFQRRSSAFLASTEAPVARANKRFYKATGAWFHKQIEAGHLRKMPPDVLAAILVGPGQEFARLHLAGQARTGVDEAADALSEAAWLALRSPDETGPAPKPRRE